jgi:transcriptional/translational regulatory protein YebC/TACO1
MFNRKGLLAIERNDNIDEDELMLLAIDLGAEDFDSDEYAYEITTNPGDFDNIRDSISEQDYEFQMAEIGFIPQNTTELTDENDIKNMVKLIEALEDSDDVQEIYHSWEIPDDLEL